MGNIFSTVSINTKLKNLDTQLQSEIHLNRTLIDIQSKYKIRLFLVSFLIFPILAFLSPLRFLTFSVIYFLMILILNFIFEQFFNFRIKRCLKNIERLEKEQQKIIEKLKNNDVSDIMNVMERNKRRELIKKNLKKRDLQLDKFEIEAKMRNVDRIRDSVIDLVIGDDPRNKFALICEECNTHNGLCKPENINNKFECYFCAHLNNSELGNKDKS